MANVDFKACGVSASGQCTHGETLDHGVTALVVKDKTKLGIKGLTPVCVKLFYFFICPSRKNISVTVCLSGMVQEIWCLPRQGNRYVESQATHGRASSTDNCNTFGLCFTRGTLITSIWWGDTPASRFPFFVLIRCV